MKTILCIALILSACTLKAQDQYIDLVWADEFNEEGSPDPDNWGFDLGHGHDGWGNQEVQSYTNNSQNVRVEGGQLIIHALKDEQGGWTSARVKSQGKKSFTYGRIVWRAKLPQGSGTWAALWLLGESITTEGWPASGEIDVMEYVGKWPGEILSAIHTPSSFGNTTNKATTQVNNVHTEFHTYELLWTPDKLAFYVDGENFYTYSPATKNSSTWPFDKPAFLIMNIAMGGGLGSDPQFETGGQRNGIDPALTQARMEVDYVRVYQAFEHLKLEGPAIVQKNQAGLEFRTNHIADATYEWSVPPGAVIVSGQGTPAVHVDWGETEGNVKVTMRLNGEVYEKEIAVTHVVKPQGSLFPLHSPEFQIRWTDADPVNEYHPSEDDGSTRVDYDVTTPSTVPSLQGTLHRAVDLSQYPIMQVRARSFNKSRTLRLRVDLVDENGNATNKAPVFNLTPFIDDGEYYDYHFDFEEMNQWRGEAGSVDKTRITKINVFVDFGVFGSAGSDSLWIENIYVTQRTGEPVTHRPSHLRGTLEGESVALTWQDNADNETGFNLYYAVARDGPYLLYTTPEENATSVVFSVSDEDPFQYFFKISASGATGETDFSNTFQLKRIVTSVEDGHAGLSVLVYPNPSHDKQIFLALPEVPAVITVFDLLGREAPLTRSASGHTTQLDLSQFPAGIYWLSITTTSGITTKKISLR